MARPLGDRPTDLPSMEAWHQGLMARTMAPGRCGGGVAASGLGVGRGTVRGTEASTFGEAVGWRLCFLDPWCFVGGVGAGRASCPMVSASCCGDAVASVSEASVWASAATWATVMVVSDGRCLAIRIIPAQVAMATARITARPAAATCQRFRAVSRSTSRWAAVF